RDMLDQQGGLTHMVREVAYARLPWQRSLRALEAAQGNAEAVQQERDRLQWQHDELQALAPRPGEWELISNEQSRLAHGQALLEGSTRTLALLDSEDASALQALNAAAQQIQQMLRHDAQLQSVADAIESARISEIGRASRRETV